MRRNRRRKSEDEKTADDRGNDDPHHEIARAMHRVALAQQRAALAGQQAALAGLHAELVGLHHALGLAPHPGTVRDRVFAVLKELGAQGTITSAATLDDLNLAGDTVCGALNSEFFPNQNTGLSEEQCIGKTMVATLILEIHELLGN